MEHYIGIIDLGSNSVRLVVYYVDRYGISYEYDNIKRVLRLSSHLQSNGELDSEGVRKTIDCLKQFKELCDARQVTEIIGVATAVIRQAKNGPALLEEVYQQTGITFRVLSGQEEAYYGYLAVVNSMSIKNALSVDIGGGSTEITLIRDRDSVESVSLPFGAVTLTRDFLQREIPTEAEIEKLCGYVNQQIASYPWLANAHCPIVAIGGTARNIAKMHQRKRNYSLLSLHQYEMSIDEVNDLCEKVRSMTLKERKSIKGLSKDRADIIVSGMYVFLSLMKIAKSNKLVTSQKGIRDGVLFERLLKQQHMDRLDNVLMFSTEQFMNRYHINRRHARYVASLAISLFDQLKNLGLIPWGEKEKKLLEVAALLHDVGRSINIYESSRHTYYLLSNVLLMGMTHEERILTALIASYRNKKEMKRWLHDHFDIVSSFDKKMIKQLGSLLLLARTLDRSMTQKIQSVVIKKEDKQLVLECTGKQRHLLEYTLVDALLEKFEKVFGIPFVLREKTTENSL